MCYFVYILYSKSLDVFYKGQTEALQDRVNRHNRGTEKATRNGVPWELIWYTKKSTRSEAVVLETKLKNLSRERLKRFMIFHKMEVAGPDDPDGGARQDVRMPIP